jgi:hypothetical protein
LPLATQNTKQTPFALSLSKCRSKSSQGFDRLSPNGVGFVFGLFVFTIILSLSFDRLRMIGNCAAQGFDRPEWGVVVQHDRGTSQEVKARIARFVNELFLGTDTGRLEAGHVTQEQRGTHQQRPSQSAAAAFTQAQAHVEQRLNLQVTQHQAMARFV